MARAVALSEAILSSSSISVIVVVGKAKPSVVIVPSKYAFLNSNAEVPKSISLSVTGTIAPS